MEQQGTIPQKMRRVFIIRKDLHLSPGKLAAMVGHCSEAYWTNVLKASNLANGRIEDGKDGSGGIVRMTVSLPLGVWDAYVYGIATKTVCEARNLNHLTKAVAVADELGMTEGLDWGYVNDRCLTELEPENVDGTTTVGVWFKPLPDDIAHRISKKYPLYRGE